MREPVVVSAYMYICLGCPWAVIKSSRPIIYCTANFNYMSIYSILSTIENTV